MTPGPGLRFQTAVNSACQTRSLVIVERVAQPTIWREYRSIRAARYHEAMDAVTAARFARFTQIHGDLAVAIDTAAGQPGMLDQTEQSIFLTLAGPDCLRCQT
jgi:hypothetical protein